MNGGVQHFLITRFNLRIRGVAADKRGEEVLTRAWLEERLEVFERFCFPSVLHQTEQRFTWLLLLDEATDPETRARLDGYRRRMSNLETVFLPPVASAVDLSGPIVERLKGDARTLVTTRLDNDDGLHQDALAAIRARVRNQREFLNLRLGFVTDGQRARVVSHKYSPFATFVEPRTAEPFRTVYCGHSHGALRKVALVRQIADRPLWLRVIHARNVANTAFEERRKLDLTSPRKVHAWFRHEVARRARRWFWPRELRREYQLKEIAPQFHVGDSG